MKLTKTQYFEFIDRTFAEMRELIHAKNNDYTAGDQEADPFRNFREAEHFGIDPLAGLANRMNDKFNRIKAYCKSGQLAVAGEGVEDAFRDMIGYSLLALGMLSEREQPDPNQLELPLDDHPIESRWRQLGPDEVIKTGDEVRMVGGQFLVSHPHIAARYWTPALGLIGLTLGEVNDRDEHWLARRSKP